MGMARDSAGLMVGQYFKRRREKVRTRDQRLLMPLPGGDLAGGQLWPGRLPHGAAGAHRSQVVGGRGGVFWWWW